MAAEYPRITAKLKPQTDERKSVWVPFAHRHEQRLLPVYDRSRKVTPKFNDDGSVTFEFNHPDQKLSELVDKFFTAAASIEEGVVDVAVNTYGSFMQLVRHLLLTNYDLDDAEIAKILTISVSELAVLFGTIFLHLRSK